jgi:hypothetical protein
MDSHPGSDSRKIKAQQEYSSQVLYTNRLSWWKKGIQHRFLLILAGEKYSRF